MTPAFRLSGCKYCGASIVWVITTRGKKAPIDPTPCVHPEVGDVWLEPDPANPGGFIADYRPRHMGAMGKVTYRAHQSTCTHRPVAAPMPGPPAVPSPYHAAPVPRTGYPPPAPHSPEPAKAGPMDIQEAYDDRLAMAGVLRSEQLIWAAAFADRARRGLDNLEGLDGTEDPTSVPDGDRRCATEAADYATRVVWLARIAAAHLRDTRGPADDARMLASLMARPAVLGPAKAPPAGPEILTRPEAPPAPPPPPGPLAPAEVLAEEPANAEVLAEEPANAEAVSEARPEDIFPAPRMR